MINSRVGRKNSKQTNKKHASYLCVCFLYWDLTRFSSLGLSRPGFATRGEYHGGHPNLCKHVTYFLTCKIILLTCSYYTSSERELLMPTHSHIALIYIALAPPFPEINTFNASLTEGQKYVGTRNLCTVLHVNNLFCILT